MRRHRRAAPTVESIESEAAEFRATATELTREMEDLRRDIACTAEDLLWEGIAKASPATTPAQQQRTDDVLDLVHRTYAPRDCG